MDHVTLYQHVTAIDDLLKQAQKRMAMVSAGACYPAAAGDYVKLLDEHIANASNSVARLLVQLNHVWDKNLGADDASDSEFGGGPQGLAE
jgi:hypothetical protein